MEQTARTESQTPASSTDVSVASRKKLTSKTFKDGAIYLFLRGDYRKPTWFCRVKVPGAKGYIYRSTRTSDEHQAFKFADDLYHRTLVKVLSGVSVGGKRIGTAIDAYVKRFGPHRSRL